MRASDSPYKKLTIIPTEFSGLDKILGVGGVPTRKILEISGRYGLGKSTLALQIIKSAQELSMDTLWCDTEFSFDEKYSSWLGVNCDKLDLIQERFAESNLDLTEEWVEKHKNALVVLDSIGGLLPRAEAEKGADGKVIGGQAKLIATFCRKIVPLLAINNVALIVLNHEFTDLMSGRLMTSGGAKLGYHKSIWLRLSPANKRVMQGENQIGEIVSADIRKNKLANTMKQSTELTMIYGDGFSKGADLMEEAKEKLFEKKGQFYFIGEEKIARGENGLREWFKVEANSERIKLLL